MARYLTEFIGTFFLILTIGMAALSGKPLAALSIGAYPMVMVYMGVMCPAGDTTRRCPWLS